MSDTMLLALERTPEQLKEEVVFLASFLLEEFKYKTPKWYGKACKAILLHVIMDEPLREIDLPYAKEEYMECERMYYRAPEHLRSLMDPVLEIFKESYRTKQENAERNRLKFQRPHYS